jgi:hypothetical protein
VPPSRRCQCRPPAAAVTALFQRPAHARERRLLFRTQAQAAAV